MKVLPAPGALSTWISPPSRWAISRPIDRPRPVPPYLRLVVPSACWNASKISMCLSAGMPMPVSVTRKATTPWAGSAAAARRRRSWKMARGGAGRTSSVTDPLSVNLTALDSRLLRTCSRRWRSVSSSAGAPWSTLTVRVRPFWSVRGRNARRQIGGQIGESEGRRRQLHLPRLDLGQVEDVADEGEQVGAGAVDAAGELDLLVGEVAVRVVGQELGQDEQAVQRRAQLVAHVGQELGLVPGADRQLLGPLLQRPPGQLDLGVLDLDGPVLLGQLGRLLLQLGVGLLQLLLLDLEQLLRRLERLGLVLQLQVRPPQLVLLGLELLGLALQLLGEALRLLEQLLGAGVGDDRGHHDADASRRSARGRPG